MVCDVVPIYKMNLSKNLHKNQNLSSQQIFQSKEFFIISIVRLYPSRRFYRTSLHSDCFLSAEKSPERLSGNTGTHDFHSSLPHPNQMSDNFRHCIWQEGHLTLQLSMILITWRFVPEISFQYADI